MIITQLTQNGDMEPERLYESPFSDIAPHRPDSIFPAADVDRLVTILNSVRDTEAGITLDKFRAERLARYRLRRGSL